MSISLEFNESSNPMIDETSIDPDIAELNTAFVKVSTIASGNKAISTKESNKSCLVTGNQNNVVNINVDGQGQPQEIISELKLLLNTSNNIFTASHCILAHFLDHYVQEINQCKKSNKSKKELIKQAKQALNISLICSDKVLIPAVSYVQSPITRSILDDYKLAFDSGFIELIGDGITWDDFCEMRLRDYNNNSSEYKIYLKNTKNFVLTPSFSSFEGSITEFIKARWSQQWSENPEAFKIFRNRDRLHLQNGFEEKVFRAANDREEEAFISRNVAKQIFSNVNPLEKTLLTDDICTIFFDYFLQKPETLFLSQIPGFKFGEPRNNSKKIDYSKLLRLLTERCQIPISQLSNIT
ncbi:MAG: hypothetical protein LH629_01845, partial [Ignavibacteria bacterium]|nr:hypothetical protein [Ignavibacteria bacterium]